MRLARPPAGDGRRRYGLWMSEALAAETDTHVEPLEGQVDADVCVVGGGYVGLWTAIRVLAAEPGVRVRVLEADLCGSGASGRNAGFAFGWWPKAETLIDRVGEQEAGWLGRALEDAVTELKDFCENEGIEAGFRRGGWLWTATSKAQLGAWRGAIMACKQLGVEPFEELAADEVRRRTGSPAHLGGALERAAATVHPAKLARGLARVARERGALVHERSPAVALDRDSGIVTTPGGSVRADAIVLCSNAWLASLRELRRAIVPISSDVVATAPMPAELVESGWSGGESVSDSRMMVHYYRTTADGRVVFGKGGGALARFGRFNAGFDFDPDRARLSAERLRELVPAADGVPIADAWGGAVDRSFDGLPFFGRLAGEARILYGAGFSGNGVIPSLVAGRVLTSLALDHDDEWSRCGLARGVPGRFPLEPARFAGGVLVREAVRRKERLEDEERDVDGVTARLAALAPSGFFKPDKGEE